jgi:transformation/transcription domain-associated protein
MQALWRTLRNPSDQIAHVAFRVLGKFGGGNRKMMIEPQALEFIDQDDIGPLLSIAFVDHKQTLSLPVKDIIEVKEYQLHYYSIIKTIFRLLMF